MPSTIFGITNTPAISLAGGQWGPTSLIGGRNAKQCLGQNSEIDFRFTGTLLTMLCNYAASVTMQVSVDGGAFVTIPNNAGAWSSVTVATGLTDTQHTCTVQHSGGTQANFYIDTDSSFTVTGAVPALTTPDPAVFGPVTYLTQTPAPFAIEGGWTNSNLAGYSSPPSLQTIWEDSSIRFRAKIGTFKLWVAQNGGKYQLQVDGKDVGAAVADVSAFPYGWITLGSGLDVTTEHEYGVSVSYVTSGLAFLYAVMTIGGTGINQAYSFAPRQAVACYGDSITLGTNGTGNDSGLAFPHKLGLQRSSNLFNKGMGGSTVKQFGSGVPAVTTGAGEATTRTPDITGITPAPAYCIVLYGTNDLAQVGGAETSVQFQTSYQAMMNALVTGLPNTKFFCLGILPRKDFLAAARAPWTAAIQAVVTALANMKVVFVATEGWIDDSAASPDLYDSVHPNATGYAKVVTRLLGLFPSGNSAFLTTPQGACDTFVESRVGSKGPLQAAPAASSGTLIISPTPKYYLWDAIGNLLLDDLDVSGYDVAAGSAPLCFYNMDWRGYAAGNYLYSLVEVEVGSDGVERRYVTTGLVQLKA